MKDERAICDGSSGNKKIGIGIIGYGARGVSFWLTWNEYFRKDCDFVGFCDISQKKIDAANYWFREREKIEDIILTTDIDEFLKRDEIDIVFVCVPQNAHAEVACKAFKAGKNVLMEKPMAHTLDDCDRIIQAQKESQKLLFMAFNLRHHSVCVETKKIIDEGIIGKVQNIVCTDFFSTGYSYFRRWHRLEKNSGGLMVEKGCHSLDLLNWFVNSTPVRVASLGGLDVFKNNDKFPKQCRDCESSEQCDFYRDVDDEKHELKRWGHDRDTFDLCVYNSEKDTCDNHLVLIEYENGAKVSYNESFVSNVRKTSGRQFSIIGTKGQLWVELNNRKIKLYKNDHHQLPQTTIEYNIPEEAGSHGGADIHLFKEIIDCLGAKKKDIKASCDVGREAVLVAIAAEVAAKELRVVNTKCGNIE